MDARAFLAELAGQEGNEGSLAHVEVLTARAPVVEPFPDVLPELLRRRLALLGVHGLYPHQRRAVDLLDAGRNVVIATGTASGKTLVYNLAFARMALADEKRTALYLFPTKALARDQLRQVRDLKLPQVRAAVFDGDTPQAERALIRRNANLIMTNPDMLHASILPGHVRWADFFLRLGLVVVDEAHVARGVFGSHVAMILRRLRRLVEKEIRTLAFCRTRKSAELVAEFARRELPGILKRRVKAYRAGYLPAERRELERQLGTGELLGVAATNALELGIDVGSLDAALLAGYPGTRASMWQQAGRAGRRGEGSLAMLVAQDDPLDQYLMQHPEDLFDKPPEAAVIDPTNPYVVGPHLACAAAEQPLTPEELDVFGPGARAAAAALTEEGRLVERRGLLHHRGRESPHRLIDIRSASGHLFAIVDRDTGAVMGTVDEARAFYHVHPGAVYLHQGEQFEVHALDLQRKVAVVARSDSDYYTQSKDTTEIELLETLQEGLVGRTPAFYGAVKVTRQVVGYQRKSHFTNEVIDTVLLDLPPQILTTKTLWWLLPPALFLKAGVRPSALPGAIHAAEHAAIGLLPLVATCDRWDVGGLSTPFHPDTGGATIFIYDGYPGGAGIAERGYLSGERLVTATLETVRTCPCSKGCPSCVVSPKCGNGNEPLDKQGAISVLAAMLGRAYG